MALVINTNVQSLNSQRMLNKSSMETSTAMERLSSGKQINSAKDDAAGLVISNRMTSQIRGLDRAVANANDGVSLIQTAEGAMEESTNILQRMRELSIQSANGIYNDSDRSTLDAEVQQLVSELDRIAETTSFNGQNLLDGTLGKVDLQVGSEANQTISLKIGALDAKTLGMGSTSVDFLSSSTTLATLTGTEALGHNDVLINGQSVVALGDASLDGTDADAAQQVLDAINTNVNGITAGMLTESTSTVIGDGVLSDAESVTIDVTNLDGTTYSVEVGGATESLSELADKINDQSGGRISASIGDDGQISISANDAAAIAFTDGGGALGTIADESGQIILTSDNDDPIRVERGGTGTLEQLDALGFRENNKPGTVEGQGIADPSQAWGVGDVTINGTAIASETAAEASLQNKINNINAVTSDTGVTATAFTTATLDFAAVDLTSLAGGDVDINGVTVTTTAGGATTTLQDVADDLNGFSDATGVSASVLGTRLVLEGNVASLNILDGLAGDVTAAFGDGTGTASLLGSSDEVAGVAATVLDGTIATGEVLGGIKLTSNDGGPISVELGANATQADIGLLESNVSGGGAFGSAISTISIATQAGAQKAIDVIDNAINTVSSTRADLGAVNNRLDFTISNLSNISEKTSSARSAIVDADFAAETANLSRAQVLQQASQAMLAQANAAPQQVLSLLR